jgi:hypothetical protein
VAVNVTPGPFEHLIPEFNVTVGMGNAVRDVEKDWVQLVVLLVKITL